MHACASVCLHVYNMYARLYVRTYVCMYLCMFIISTHRCVHVHTYIHTAGSDTDTPPIGRLRQSDKKPWTTKAHTPSAPSPLPSTPHPNPEPTPGFVLTVHTHSAPAFAESPKIRWQARLVSGSRVPFQSHYSALLKVSGL